MLFAINGADASKGVFWSTLQTPLLGLQGRIRRSKSFLMDRPLLIKDAAAISVPVEEPLELFDDLLLCSRGCGPWGGTKSREQASNAPERFPLIPSPGCRKARTRPIIKRTRNRVQPNAARLTCDPDPGGPRETKPSCHAQGLRPIGHLLSWRGACPCRKPVRTLTSEGAQLSCFDVWRAEEVNVDAGAHRGLMVKTAAPIGLWGRHWVSAGRWFPAAAFEGSPAASRP